MEKKLKVKYHALEDGEIATAFIPKETKLKNILQYLRDHDYAVGRIISVELVEI